MTRSISDWTVSFEPERGAPESAQFDRLDFVERYLRTSAMKYFSGTATYSKTIEIPASAFRPERISGSIWAT